MIPINHSRTLLSALDEAAAHEIFRATCAVTDPIWTQCGPDPEKWQAPSDAAGGLVLWDEEGFLIRIEPCQHADAERQNEVARRTYYDLVDAGSVIGCLRASYASSGGRVVALCESRGQWWITVARSESPPRAGATERQILIADPKAVVYVPTETKQWASGPSHGDLAPLVVIDRS